MEGTGAMREQQVVRETAHTVPVSDDEPSPKKSRELRTHFSRVEGASTLEDLLVRTLPDKEPFFRQWLAALAAPAVCICSIEDIQRLDVEDIATLPVPPLLKGVFREVLSREEAKHRNQKAALEATLARSKEFMRPLVDRNMQPPLAGSKYFQDAKSYRLILTREEISAGVRIVARRIENWCKGERIILVGILKGAFMFVSDLCRALVRPYSVYFVEASSYKEGRAQGGMQISADISSSKFVDTTTKILNRARRSMPDGELHSCDEEKPAPHKIVLIDELLDNGKTMEEMRRHFLSQLSGSHTEKDILTVCLFSKNRERTWPNADITGIPNVPDLWLVGYGLDDRGTKRGWSELFAMPKVKIVETIETEEVERLMAGLDDAAMLTAPVVFAGFELTFNHKQKYRVCGINTEGGHSLPSLQVPEAKVTSKADAERILARVPVLKGKYDHDIAFAFIQENVSLVPEDEIFSGNNHMYAEMRCALRKQIAAGAARFGVEGLEAI